jgi:hypothetical protein
MATTGQRPVKLQYSRANFKRRLSSIQPNLESIQSLSHFMLFMAPVFATALINDWAQVLAESERERRLHLLYVANDVLQLARSRLADATVQQLSNLFLDAMERYLGVLAGDERFERLFEVWRSRDVFTEEQLGRLQAHINDQREWRVRFGDVAQHVSAAIARLTDGDSSSLPALDAEDQANLLDKLREVHHLVERYLSDLGGCERRSEQADDAQVASWTATTTPQTKPVDSSPASIPSS